MEENKDKIEENEKTEIESALKSLEEDIKTDDLQRIKLGVENLQQSMHSFSQRIYSQQTQDQAYQQAAQQAQQAASGMGGMPPGGMGGKKDKDKKEKDKKRVVDVDWEESEE